MTFKIDREIMKIADHIEALAFKMVAPNAYTPMFASAFVSLAIGSA